MIVTKNELDNRIHQIGTWVIVPDRTLPHGVLSVGNRVSPVVYDQWLEKLDPQSYYRRKAEEEYASWFEEDV